MPSPPTFFAALRFWLKLGFISFGGPAGQIAIMHAELVERRKWIEENRFLHALNFCMLLPGPEATQLATYCGWLLHGTRGGLVAGILFVLPATLLLWILSWIYAAQGQIPAVAAVFHGLKPAVTAIVAAAVIRIGRRALRRGIAWAVAGAAFIAIYFLNVPFPAIVAGAALLGWLASDWRGGFLPQSDAVNSGPRPASFPAGEWGRGIRVLLIGLLIWWAPVLVAGTMQGWDGILAREGAFFGRAAMVTFGGAYAVLPYVGQQAVLHHGWLSAPQMLDGLGLAETTPGPLIIVVEFVGFLGAWQHPGSLNPLVAGTLGVAITLWATFVPSYLWILVGAPHVERIRESGRWSSALAAVTAAVVGVVLNLAVWFGQHVFHPGEAGWDVFAVVLALAAFVAMQFLRVGIIPVVLLGGLAGWVAGWF